MRKKGMQVSSRLEPPALEGSFAELYRSELPYVWNSLRRLGTPAAELEDLSQEVFVRVFRALPGYDHDRPFRPWLFGLLFHTMLDFRKRQSRSPEGHAGGTAGALADAEILPDQALEREEDRKLVLKALEAVKLSRRTVFVMVELNGHSVPEVAEALALPLNTTYSRLRLARQEFVAAVRRLTLREVGA
jgi:RNA polymerase sigma-70 factor (ECF subfamily)